jgi:hypothetical protein
VAGRGAGVPFFTRGAGFLEREDIQIADLARGQLGGVMAQGEEDPQLAVLEGAGEPLAADLGERLAGQVDVQGELPGLAQDVAQ